MVGLVSEGRACDSIGWSWLRELIGVKDISGGGGGGDARGVPGNMSMASMLTVLGWLSSMEVISSTMVPVDVWVMMAGRVGSGVGVGAGVGIVAIVLGNKKDAVIVKTASSILGNIVGTAEPP